jgi:hypothetical protein
MAVLTDTLAPLPFFYFAPPAGTFAFSSSNQFWMRLMCVTAGAALGGIRDRVM